MTKEELLEKLSEYSKKVNTGVATTADHGVIKDHIQTAYGAGSIPKELKSDLGKKATFSFKNMFSSKGLSDLPQKVVEKGGQIGKFVETAPAATGGVFKTAGEAAAAGTKKAGKGLKSFGPLLGMLGSGALAMGAGQKAMAGDIPGAVTDAADLATDYIPGISNIKQALQSDPLGAGSDEVKGKEHFDFSPYREKPKPESVPVADSDPNSKFKKLKGMLGGALG